MHRVVGIILAGVVGLLFISIGGLQFAVHQSATQGTQQTEGVVTGTDVIPMSMSEPPESYAPVVEYRYEVGNETYASDTVYPGPTRRTWSGEAAARNQLDEYEVNQTVTVHYRTSNPQQSYLVQTGPSPATVLFIGVGLALVGFAAYLVRSA